MIDLLGRYVDRFLDEGGEKHEPIEGFEDLSEKDKIESIKDLIKQEPSEERNNDVKVLSKNLDRDLFIKLVLSILEELSSRGIIDEKASREEIEEYLIERMNIFRWENVENFEMISRKVILNQLTQEDFASKSYTNPIDYLTSLTQGTVEESEITLSKDGEDIRKLNYSGNQELEHKFDSINVIDPEVRLFINKILENKNSGKRLYKLVPYTASKKPGKATKTKFYIFCTEEEINYINQYLHYEKLDYQPSKKGRFVSKVGFFVN